MPLHGKDPFEFYKCRVKPGEEYFEIKFTKEHFKRYKDYIERYELYMEKIWTCSITGRKNLSFEEALLSEKLASEKVSKLPELILPHCLEFIQYKELTLDELTTQLYDFLIMNYFPGEIVAFKKNNLKLIGRVIEHVDESEVDEDEDSEEKKSNTNVIKKKSNGQSPSTTTPPLNSNTTEDEDNSNNKATNSNNKNSNNKQLYSDDDESEEEKEKEKGESEDIEIDDDTSITTSTTNTSATSTTGEKKVNRKYLDPRKKLDSMKKFYKIYVDSQGKNFIANIKEITRREPPIYKPMVKDTIKTMAKKTKHLGGYWECDPHIMKKFNLDNIPIPDHLRKEVEQHQRKKRQLADERNGDYSDGDFDGSDYEGSRRKKSRGSEESGSANTSDQSDSEQRKRKKPKFPIEDQDIERDEAQDQENLRPVASSNFFCQPATYGDFLMIWHFINHFEKVLLLTPFSLEDFELSLQHQYDNPILVESHVRLLKLIFTLPSYSSGTPKKTFGNKVLTDRNWFAALKAYFQNEVKRKAIEEKEKQENLKQVEQNNKRMMILANELPGSDDEEEEVIIQDEEDKMKIDNETENKKENDENMEEEAEEEAEAEEENEEEAEEEEDEDEDYESEEDYKQITSPDPNIINKVLKKKSYFKLSVDERIYILAYLVQQTIASDKIRKHLDKIVEVSNELKQEKKEVNLEEKQLKIEKLEEDTNNDNEDEEDEEDEEPVNKQSKKKQQQERDLNQLEKQKEALDIKLEKYSTRLESLGRDRIYRNYWYWTQLPGRLYVENENGEWEYYSSKEEIDDLMKFLDNRGIRERKLLNNIKSKYDQICTQLEKKNKEIIDQIQFEAKRSQRIKTLYSEKSYLSYTNKYDDQ